MLVHDAQSDEQLVAQVLAGDLSAFDVLVQRYASRVFRFALRMVACRDDACDIQQETFILAYRHLRGYRGDASMLTWLYVITAKLCISHRRRAARRPAMICLDEAQDTAWHDPATDEAERVQRALATLAPADRLLIVLKYVEGLSHEEIARVLHCSAESSRSRLTRAKKLFRERFE